MKKISFYNEYHLGDCVFTINFLNNIIKCNSDIDVIFYLNKNYLDEIYPMIINHNRMHIDSLENIKNDSINLWINIENSVFEKLFYMNEGLFKLSKYICYKHDLKNPYKTSHDVLFDHPDLYKKNSLCYEHDYLIINAVPLSGQFNFEPKYFNEITSILLEKGKKVITTHNTGLTDYTFGKYKLIELGAISLYSKNIISINTSPTVVCLNKYNIDKLDSCIIMDYNHGYNYNPKIININDISIILNDIKKL